MQKILLDLNSILTRGNELIEELESQKTELELKEIELDSREKDIKDRETSFIQREYVVQQIENVVALKAEAETLMAKNKQDAEKLFQDKAAFASERDVHRQVMANERVGIAQQAKNNENNFIELEKNKKQFDILVDKRVEEILVNLGVKK